MSVQQEHQPGSAFAYPHEAYPVGAGYGVTPAQIHAQGGHAPYARGASRSVTSAKNQLLKFLPLALAALAGLLFIAATGGGREARRATPIVVQLDRLLAQVGLGIGEISVTGQRMTRDSDIYRQLDLGGRHSLWLLDTEHVRTRIETLPWVESAAIRRIFPDRLKVAITERKPAALWRRSGKHPDVLMDNSGRLLGTVGRGSIDTLPVIIGDSAPGEIAEIRRLVRSIPEISRRFRHFEWTGARRWTLHLRSRRRILLPAIGWQEALRAAARGPAGKRLIDIDFSVLDLRIPQQTTVRRRTRSG